jgi:hypothetical protein
MENNLVSMSQQFSGLPMEDLIGGPLNAAAKANSAMALTQTRFLLDTCFGKKEEVQGDVKTTTYNPVMIEMSLERGVLSKDKDGNLIIEKVTTKFNLPLLTIIPLNSLAVDTVDVNFEMEVKSSYSETQDETKETAAKGDASFETKVGWGPLSVSIKGSASYSSKDSETHNTHYEKSNSAKYTVNVHAAQLPVPKGVNTIIEAFTQSIQPIEVPSSVQIEDKNNKS